MRAKKGQYKLTRKFDGKNYSVYGGGTYTKSEANNVVKYLKEHGKLARKIKVYGKWVVYFK